MGQQPDSSVPEGRAASPGTRLEGVAAGDVGKRSTEIVGERNGMNYTQVQRYIRLTELVPELQSMVNEKKLSFTPAVEISFIKPKNDCSHGFRINKSCHTALKYVQKYFTETKWFVEGDIKGCFDNVDQKSVDCTITTGSQIR